MIAPVILAAFLRREWGISRSYRLAYVLSMATTVINLTFYFALGRLIDGSGAAPTAALEQGYFTFVIVPLSLLNLGTSALTSFSASLRAEQQVGSLEVLLTTPAPVPLIVLGTAAYGLIQAAISTVILVSLAALIFGLNLDVGLWSGTAAAAALLLTCGLYAALGLLAASFTIVYKRTGQFLNLTMTVIGVFSGVYFPVSVLPEPLPILARLIPFTWGIEAWRDALLTNQVLLGHLALLLVEAVVALPVAAWIFRLALDRARRDGSLGQY